MWLTVACLFLTTCPLNLLFPSLILFLSGPSVPALPWPPVPVPYTTTPLELRHFPGLTNLFVDDSQDQAGQADFNCYLHLSKWLFYFDVLQEPQHDWNKFSLEAPCALAMALPLYQSTVSWLSCSGMFFFFSGKVSLNPSFPSYFHYHPKSSQTWNHLYSRTSSTTGILLPLSLLLTTFYC